MQKKTHFELNTWTCNRTDTNFACGYEDIVTSSFLHLMKSETCMLDDQNPTKCSSQARDRRGQWMLDSRRSLKIVKKKI